MVILTAIATSFPLDRGPNLSLPDDSTAANISSYRPWAGVCYEQDEKPLPVDFENCKVAAREFDFDLFPTIAEWTLSPDPSNERTGVLHSPYSLVVADCKFTVDYWPKDQTINLPRKGGVWQKANEIGMACTKHVGHEGILDYLWGGYLRFRQPVGGAHTVQITLENVEDTEDTARVIGTAKA